MYHRWSVGALSEQLGIAAPTLRTWERRYGIGPSFRTAGGHRRYTITDADRVAVLAKFIAEGLPARDAAARAARLPAHELAALAGTGPGGSAFSTREFGVLGLLAATRELDGPRIQEVALAAIDRFGVIDAWDDVLAPALIEIGAQWADGRLGVEAEHLVSSRLLTALRVSASQAPVASETRVVLASTQDEQHKLPVVALDAALAHQSIAAAELGSRLPLDSLTAFVDATEVDVVFLWSSVGNTTPDSLRQIEALRTRATVLLGGPGWPRDLTTAQSLGQAVEQIVAALDDDLR